MISTEDESTASVPYLDYIAAAPLNHISADRPLTDDIAALERFVHTNLGALPLKDMNR